jgi:acetyltransferase-like isoleucine patch superfamily enzyme
MIFDESEYNIENEANNTIETEIRHFINSIYNNGLKNGFKVENSGLLGAETVRLLELAQESIKKMCWITLKNDYTPNYSIIKDIEVGQGSLIYDQVNLYKCKIGKNTKIDSYVYIEEDVIIGDNCKIRPFTFIPTGVLIEDDVFIGPNVTFTNDKYPRSRGEWKQLSTIVKKGASIGAHSVILPGITIGENAMIGAGSVVTKDIKKDSVVYGNPVNI